MSSINRRALLQGLSVTLSTSILLSGCATSGGGTGSKTQRQYSLAFTDDITLAGGQARRGTLIVSPIKIASPYHRKAISYQSTAYEIAQYAYNEWADLPERMLDSSLLSTLTRAQLFTSVAPISAPITGDYRLDMQITKLYQDFTASPSIFVIDAAVQLYDINLNKQVGQSQFGARVPAQAENAAAGVIAANEGLRQISEQLVQFLAR